MYQNEALGALITKKWFSRSPRSSDPKLGGIWGQITYIFKPGQIIYQNEALDALMTKKWFPGPEIGSSEVRG